MEAMLVDYGKSVVQSTLGELGKLLLHEVQLIGSIRDDILFIRDELQSMDAVMADMIRAGSLSHQNKVWMLHVLQVAYEAELCMEEFNDHLNKDHRDRKGLVNKAVLRAGNFLRTVQPRHRIAMKIQNLKVQATEVSQRQSRYNIAIPTKVTDITGSAVRAAVFARRGQFSSRLMPEDALFRSNSFKELLGCMNNTSSKVIVISGPAGFGKTALAKMVYRRRNDPIQCSQGFKKSAWVTLSKNPDINKVLAEILRQVRDGTKNGEGDKLTTDMTAKLKEELTTNSYLIVLDSLWRKEDWEHIRNALPAANQEGTIILTTRQNDVVEACRPEGGFRNVQPEFKRADKYRLCTLMVLNILNTWWDKILFDWIMNWLEEYDWVIILLLFVITSVVLVLLVIRCILHPIMTTIAIGIIVGLKFILHFNLIDTVLMTVIVPIVLIYNLFIWLFKQVAKLFQRGRYFHLTSWTKIPLNRVETYKKLLIKERHVLVYVPLAVKFITGALIAKSMDSHKTDELFDKLKPLPIPKTNTNHKDQQPKQGDQQQTHQPPEEGGQQQTHQQPEQVGQQQTQQPPEEGGHQQTQQPPEQGGQQHTHQPPEEGRQQQTHQPPEQGGQQQTHQPPEQGGQKAQQTPPPPKQEVEQTPLAKQNNQDKASNKNSEGDHLKEEKLKDVIHHCYEILKHNSTLKKYAEDLDILPEGYVINRKRLTRRWVNLDVISTPPGLSIEQVAESCFDELVIRGFIDVESIDSCGNVKSCRINSVFKEYLAGISENGQQTSPQKSCTQPLSPPPDSSHKTQTNFSILKGLKGLKKKLTSPKNSAEPSDGPDLESYKGLMLKVFPLNKFDHDSLTVLDLEGCQGLLPAHLMSLSKYTNLRFLSLRNTGLEVIPEKMGKFENLETLDVRQTKISNVPNDILPSNRLKHLRAGGIYKPENTENTCDIKLPMSLIEVPTDMEQMRSIQTLAYVDATSSLLLRLREMTQLKKLGLVIRKEYCNFNSKPLCISLMLLFASLLSLSILDERANNSLGFLEYLCFPPLNLKSLTLMGFLERLPQWIANHKHLAKLTIMNTQLSSDAMRLIGKIPTLRCLKLYKLSFIEEILTLGEKEFPVLRTLVIHCDCIQKVIFQKGTAPKLEVIRWVLSNSVAKDVDGMRDLPMLKEVSLIGDVNMEIQRKITQEVESHPNYANNTMLVFEKIEKPITQPEGGKKKDPLNTVSRQPNAAESGQPRQATPGKRPPQVPQWQLQPAGAPGGEPQPSDAPKGAAT